MVTEHFTCHGTHRNTPLPPVHHIISMLSKKGDKSLLFIVRLDILTKREIVQFEERFTVIT